MNEAVLEVFCRFAKAHVESGDIDPTYPLLKRVYAAQGLDRETALWRTLLYVTFYHLGSALHVSKLYPSPTLNIERELRTFPTGTERRGFRGNCRAWEHLGAFLRRAGSRGGLLVSYFDFVTHAGGKAGWFNLRFEAQQIAYCGPWASYKLADLLKHVHDYPITASDIGVGGGSETAGPVPGMVRVTGADWKRCAADVGLQQELHDECVRRGVPFNGLDQLETALCDFNSLCLGRYYVGHDIDDQQEKIDGLPPLWWEQRAHCFPSQYLGERGGWFGVRKERKTVYRDRGELLL